MELAAVILAGGTGARLGGADKASIDYAGTTLLDRALAAVEAAVEVVVVADPTPTSRPVTFAREEPAFGGPVAGLLAGRAALTGAPDLLVVLAVDMPHVTAGTVSRLAAAVDDADGAVLTGADGRRRLAFVVRTDRLDAVAPADPDGAAVHALLAPLALREVTAVGREASGVDTVEDLRHLDDEER
jgi:molybdopterin-guanine dinucleotide biosynthesis protein A